MQMHFDGLFYSSYLTAIIPWLWIWCSTRLRGLVEVEGSTDARAADCLALECDELAKVMG